MATNKTYTKVEIEAIKEGLNHYFPYEVGDISSPKTVDDNWSDINKLFKWYGRDDFFTTLSEATGIQKLSFAEIKSASGRLEKMEAVAPEATEYKGAEESPVSANRPTNEQLKQFQEEDLIQKEKVEKISRESKADVEAFKRQQEIYTEKIQKTKILEEALKNKKIYYKVEEAKTELEKQAEAKPKKFVEDTETQFKNSPNLKNLSQDQAKIESEQAAVTTYDVLTNNPNSPIFRAVIAEKIISNPELLNKFVPNLENQKILKDISSVLTDQKIAQFELAKHFVRLPENINFEFSDFPQQGYKDFDLSQIASGNVDFLNQQNLLLDSLDGLGEGEIRSRILLSVGGRLTNYVASLPADSLLAQTYNSGIVQLGLARIGIIESASLVAESWGGNVFIAAGLGDVGLFVQTKTGIDLGIKVAAKEVGKQVVEKTGEAIVEGGINIAGEGVGKIGLTAVLTPAFAWAGPLAPILAGITSFVATSFIGKGVSDAFSKIKVFIKRNDLSAAIPALLGGGIAIPFLGLGAGLGIGGGIFGGLKLAGSTSAGRAAFGRGVGNFFGAIAGATLGAIGGPILGILLGFPVIVVFILFIINSGAYIVPPSLSELNIGGFSSPYVDLTKTPNPPGPFTNSDFPKEITYTVSITPKKGALTNVNISYGCQVVSKSNLSCPDIELEDSYKNIFSSPQTISITGITFTYKSTYDSSYKDSAIIDSIKLNGVSASDSVSVSTETSASVTFGTPPISCPVPGAKPLNSMNLSYNSGGNTGHGSTTYWNAMGGSPYRYPMPQSTSCLRPDDCSYYGYAYDVFPTGSQEVFAPTVLGKDVTWSCGYAFINPGAGHTYHCTSSDGNYLLSLTHMSKSASMGTVKSGQKIGTLYPQAGNTHLHIEFQLNGRWQKPENYFCQTK